MPGPEEQGEGRTDVLRVADRFTIIDYSNDFGGISVCQSLVTVHLNYAFSFRQMYLNKAENLQQIIPNCNKRDLGRRMNSFRDVSGGTMPTQKFSSGWCD